MDVVRAALYVPSSSSSSFTPFWYRHAALGTGLSGEAKSHRGPVQGFEAVAARRLVVHFLHALSASGWHLYTSTGLSKKAWDKDTLIFRPGPSGQRDYFSISFDVGDKIRLIDSPSQSVTLDFIAAVRVSRSLYGEVDDGGDV